jgi:hypothetical protein
LRDYATDLTVVAVFVDSVLAVVENAADFAWDGHPEKNDYFDSVVDEMAVDCDFACHFYRYYMCRNCSPSFCHFHAHSFANFCYRDFGNLN